ncbi:MAG: hypothetical protein DYG93_07750 [Leptolyngbya sp. PLA2]|nr:hypothetical protein [Leptolyngbya sp.]MCE7971541.1 hypothetical protein [Leptolyngbya sp. PL-A2]MCQ3940755.1 hypothetical protein [cyanobacterium CYA1]MDL1903725.1 hypothetical protein [Synechococcales cyanobacterium CNB]
MTTTNPEPTAAEAYAARSRDIARLIDVLQMELEAHAKRAAVADRNWGYPGDLGKVRRDLIDLAAFMSGKTTEEVEAFLDDAAADDEQRAN